MSIIEELWLKYSKCVSITKHPKAWWNEKCNRNLSAYQISRSRSGWSNFKKLVKKAKRVFFNNKIQEIALKNKRL